jgi:RNA recognition motif-containing protein
MKLMARNLSRETTEADLREFFAVHGTVASCDLVLDKVTGKSKGFGFVEMPKKLEAHMAIKALNNKSVAGSVIRVKEVEPG